MRHRVEDDHELGRQLQRQDRPLAGRQLDELERYLVEQPLEVVGQIDARAPKKIWRQYSAGGSVSGSWAAILRTRGLTVNVTSTISSSVGS